MPCLDEIKNRLIQRAAKLEIRLIEDRNGLLAPISYFCLTEYQKKNICNGCGPGWLRRIIPDNPNGINFKLACDIHDYTFNDLRFTFMLANDLFKYNLKICASKSDQDPGVKQWTVIQYAYAVRGLLGRFFYYRARRK